jgi:hypothetical protein
MQDQRVRYFAYPFFFLGPATKKIESSSAKIWMVRVDDSWVIHDVIQESRCDSDSDSDGLIHHDGNGKSLLNHGIQNPFWTRFRLLKVLTDK